MSAAAASKQELRLFTTFAKGSAPPPKPAPAQPTRAAKPRDGSGRSGAFHTISSTCDLPTTQLLLHALAVPDDPVAAGLAAALQLPW